MSWAGKQHPLEAAVEWLAPITLSLAVGWAGWRLGLSTISSVGLGAAALAAGIAAFRLAGRGASIAIQGFQPAEFESIEAGELLLEEKDSILELHDRLEEPNPDSRVVRLFERHDPTPGELVDRIVDFLSESRRPDPVDHPMAESNRLPDASAALHDALANIRASLR